MKFSFAILLLACAAVLVAAVPLTVERLHELRRVSSQAANARGDLVWSERVWQPAAVGPGVVTTNLMVRPAGGVAKQLTSKTGVTDTGATFSDDGNTVFFLSSRSGSMQVWSVPVTGSEANVQQVTNFPIDVDNVRFFKRQGQAMLLYTMSVYYDRCAPGDLACTAAENKKVEARGPNTWKEYDQLFVRHWDEWEVQGKGEHIFIQNVYNSGSSWKVDPSTLRDLMPNMNMDAPVPPFGGLEQIDVSPKGDEVAYTAVYRESSAAWTTGWKIFTVSLATGETKLITDFPARATNPAYSPDGRWIAYLAMNVPGHESDKLHIERYDRQNPDNAAVTITNQTDISFSGFAWDATSTSVIADADYYGYHLLFSIDMYTSLASPPDLPIKRAPLSPMQGTYSSLVRIGSTNNFVCQYNSMMAPTDLYSFTYSFDAGAGKGTMQTPVQLTFANQKLLDGIELQQPTRFSFTGAMGQTVEGWIVKPYGFQEGKTYPVVNLIHGGPEGSWADDWSYRWNPMLWTGHGYGVVMIDFHGSTGYGQNFTDSILGQWGGYPYYDVMKGIQVAIEQNSWMDASRVAACGASYGGYMINWIQGHTTFYRALVTHDGMFDTYNAYFTTDELWFNEAEFFGTPWEAPELYDTWNPRNFVDKWQTPHLIIQGQHDYRLTLGNGLAVFTALQRRGIPSKFLYFTMENHWVLNDVNGIKWYHTVLDWLDTYTK